MLIGKTATDARIQPFDWTDGTGHRNTHARLTGQAATRDKQTKNEARTEWPPTGATRTGGARTAQANKPGPGQVVKSSAKRKV